MIKSVNLPLILFIKDQNQHESKHFGVNMEYVFAAKWQSMLALGAKEIHQYFSTLSL